MNDLILSSVILLLLDFVWLGTYMGPRYNKMIREIQGKQMKMNYWSAIITYILMIVGLNVFVIPNIREKSAMTDSIKYGFLFGIVLYGVYDFTAATVLDGWDIGLALLDTLWGGIVYFLTAFMTIKIISYNK